MKCQNCGNEVKGKFCKVCGAKLTQEDGSQYIANGQFSSPELKMPFYHKTWFVILMLIIFFPVGLFLLWKNRHLSKRFKVIATAIVAVWVLVSVMSDSPSPEDNSATVDVPAISVENNETEFEEASSATEFEYIELNETTNESESEKTISDNSTNVETNIDSLWADESSEISENTETTASENPEVVSEPTPANTVVETEPTVSVDFGHDYVLNTSTMKFHYPSCRDVAKIKSGNRKDVHQTRDEAIAQGYSPCGHCHP